MVSKKVKNLLKGTLCGSVIGGILGIFALLTPFFCSAEGGDFPVSLTCSITNFLGRMGYTPSILLFNNTSNPLLMFIISIIQGAIIGTLINLILNKVKSNVELPKKENIIRNKEYIMTSGLIFFIIGLVILIINYLLNNVIYRNILGKILFVVLFYPAFFYYKLSADYYNITLLYLSIIVSFVYLFIIGGLFGWVILRIKKKKSLLKKNKKR